MQVTYLGLPNQSVGVGITQLFHDFVDSGSYLLGIGVPSVDNLQSRQNNRQSPTLWGCQAPLAIQGQDDRGLDPSLALLQTNNSWICALVGKLLGSRLSLSFPVIVQE